MKTSISYFRPHRRWLRGFSLMELLLAMGIMAVIVGALYGMFHHTQRALRSNVTQVDVLEAGRATMDVLTRELAQISPAPRGGDTNLLGILSPMLLFPNDDVRQKALYYETNPPANFSSYTPTVQRLMVGGQTRTNLLQEVYFLSRVGDKCIGTCYRVINVTNGVGTLARHSLEIPARFLSGGWLASNVIRTQATAFSHLAPGVIHFRVTPYDGDGFRMQWEYARRYTNWVLYPGLYLTNNVFLERDRVYSETAFRFLSNALPSYLEIELGVLEPKARDQLAAFEPRSAMAERYLANRAGQVHLFRQRVAIQQAPFIQAMHP